ncbi:MAG: hypothetical protein KJ955_03150 [Nanoarchaeota archaeon]|nr:hypothetical protein [Nanoarchaeota archaeon]
MANTQKDRLTALVQRTCEELEIPDKYLVRFAQDVAGSVRDMGLNPVNYDAGIVFNAVNTYEMMILNGPFEPKMWEEPEAELSSYAATTAAYFLAKESTSKDEGLRNLFRPEKKEVR